ncbi:family 20 glycosylhydrolase [Microbacterium imperiale]|uniref:beta-N-acetylhexosaminidase n=1 Tax=Microbacterium imperiale TaxID=33884 RepID=A0A9W6HD87_9MICO|nr:family 20 glycosylhydrolase [Microbacterium imperiale]MBP2420318.1 hexosaminidase [Microbacterium imperiale]MDS0197822.1 beta-N-acetylhexosaminidase [Microbacterium imperiale]BFE40660.1 beta-N-acetylhexosaminidase [Microbacterium imperiale]GLJ78366.1 beta-N-acetylhexosaminidase [Microbacterium imperiale]
MTSLPLVPLPAAVTSADGPPFALDRGVRITGDASAAAVLHRLVATRTGVHLGHADDADASDAARIAVTVDGAGPAESYRLAVRHDGIEVRGADAAGLFYGIQTLGQLITGSASGWTVPAVDIDDAPRFAYRGVMLDVARHFHDVATVTAFLERAASLKFNVLHLHLSDDQAWRLELHSRPELTARTAAGAVGGDPGGLYTQADYRSIIEHAAAHHMTVVPEFDMPGHTHAVGIAYPEVAAAPALEGWDAAGGPTPVAGEAYTGIGVGFSSLRIGDDATDAFVADVFTELAALTPGPYLHFGGDEAHGTPPADFAAFVERTSALIASLGKTPIAWHEAGAAGDLAPGTVGQYWSFVRPAEGAADKARAFVTAGGRVILSPADAVYLDMKPDETAALGLTWANGPTSLERAYRWEPADVVEGLSEDDILGVEAPLWTETVRTLDDIDALTFPRIAAAAEAAWSPPTGRAPGRTWESFRSRVGGLGPLWTTLDIRFPASPEVSWTL